MVRIKKEGKGLTRRLRLDMVVNLSEPIIDKEALCAGHYDDEGQKVKEIGKEREEI